MMNITEKTNIVKQLPHFGHGAASYAIYDRDTGDLIGCENDYRTAQRVAREYVERKANGEKEA